MESHCGDASEFYTSFYASSDEEAKKELERIRRLPSSGMSTFSMERIDAEEKITRIS